MQFLDWFRKKGLSWALYVLTALMLISAILIFIYRSQIRNTHDKMVRSAQILLSTEIVKSKGVKVDLAIRNYKISGQHTDLQEYKFRLQELRKEYDSLQYKLQYQNSGVNTAGIGDAVQRNESYLSLLQSDGDIKLSKEFQNLPFISSAVEDFEKELKLEQINLAGGNDSFYLNALIVLLLIILTGTPFLITTDLRMNKLQTKLSLLNHQIAESNCKYVFNPDDKTTYNTVDESMNSLIANLEKATNFIQNISKGNYEIQWDGMNEKNAKMNQTNIAGELIRMREQMKQVKEKDRQRIWITEGLSRFGDIIRKRQDNIEMLLDNLISSLVKYVNVNVGGLFILEEQDENQVLQLRACYAYDRKKYINKTVELGEGLIGQAYMEGRTIYLKKVPEDYIKISSGLGDTKPKCLLVVPLRSNDKIEGVLELAAFKEFEAHEIEFLEQLTGTLASAILTTKTAGRTQSLLNTSQQRAEELRAQDEEMRQNMEEIQATQEQMGRQMLEANELKGSLEQERYLFASLMDNLPDNIYFKDRQSKLIRVSKFMCDAFGLPEKKLIGKSDFDFQDDAYARLAYDDEQNIMATGKPKINFLEKETREDGTEIWVSTTKMPLINSYGEVVGTFGISRDVSKLKNLEKDVLAKTKLLKDEEEECAAKIRTLEEALKVLGGSIK